MEWREAYRILEELFPMPKARAEKCEALFSYAQRVRDGCIVELGTALGCGAIALALGAPPGIKVFTIDDFAIRKGWAQEPYGPENEAICTANFEKAGVNVSIVKARVDMAHEGWYAPVGLLHWDLGMFSGMGRDFINWEPYVIKGGNLLLHDTSDQALGSREVAEHAIRTKRFRGPRHVGGGLWAFEKRPNIVCCAGMSRSGGTLQYLITKTIAEMSGVGRGIGHGQNLSVLGSSPELLVFKSEEPKEWILDMVREEKVDVVGIFRDPRDVAASLEEWYAKRDEVKPELKVDWHQTIGTVINHQKIWESLPDVYMARYETCKHGGWVYMTLEIANHLGIRLDTKEAIAIAREWSLKEQRKRIVELEVEDSWFAMEWLLTRAHIGRDSGKIGRFLDDLSTDDIKYVENIATREWMANHGYRILDN